MRQMGDDLGTRLDWIAVDHYDTGRLHSHIVLPGKDLVIARDYLSQGMREGAAKVVTLDLGPRTDRQIERQLRDEVEQERLTSLGRGLLREVVADGIVRSGTSTGDAFRQTLGASRVQKLRRLGLAEEIAPSQWRSAGDLEPVLRRIGERVEDPAPPDAAGRPEPRTPPSTIPRARTYANWSAASSPVACLMNGRAALSRPRRRRRRAHYVDIGRDDAIDPLPHGAIVAIEHKRTEPCAVDRALAEIAADGGRYSLDIHPRQI